MLKLHKYKIEYELDYNYYLNKRTLQIIEMATNEPTNLPFNNFQQFEFGDVLEWEVPNYSLKKEPILTAGKKGKGKKELDAMGLFFDEDTQQIFIADFVNSRVQVMSLKGEFITSFGQDVLKHPYGISVNKDHIFVTDWVHNSIFKFCKNTLELLNSTKGSEELQLSEPSGLCIDSNGDVFVADRFNHRIVIFSTNLQFKYRFCTHKVYYPQDVKLTPDCVVVLDWSSKCIHLFSRDGDYLSSCISQGEEQNSLVRNPLFFCLDLSGNILISDLYHHCIKIFTQSGEFIHSIGREGNKKGEFIQPRGIAISKSGVIFVVSDNPNYSLQCF